ncbi:MAG: response regulator [Nitrospirae bacterium]|nr:response regulator [Nitrospirota bacterium]
MTTLLIVDDNIVVRVSLNEILTAHGYNVIEAESGQEALNILRENNEIDIILLDYDMPTMNGLITFEHIKEEINDYPPVIMVTGYGSMDLAVEFMKKGGIDFIQKPIDFYILMLKIEHVIDFVIKDKSIKELQREKTELSILLNAAAALSHEINNPLNIIYHAVDLVKKLPEDAKYLQNIKDAMNRIKEVVKNFSNIKSVKMKPYISGIEILDIKESTDQGV